MKSIIAQIVLVVVYTFAILFLWEYKGRQHIFKPEIKIVKKTEIKWIDRIIERPYDEITFDECKNLLACFDTSKPYLDITNIEGNNITVTSKLCEREWSRAFTLNTSSSGNWKFYVGVGLAGAIAGYIIHKNL
ncbi:MAG: hypothetical protein JSW06_02820 [Thermoplasmatales archaeon]|nr:MAG: hypothetical protein JSW06_02820 [Thermoplasmatales archaeon]